MYLHYDGDLRYYQFESLQKEVRHAIFTRRGGVSPRPWESLNMGGTVGDEIKRVNENRSRGLAALGIDSRTVFDVWQVHSSEVVIANAPHPSNLPRIKADAILTNQKGITLMMRFADCVPIFFYDPIRKIIGIAHAGWLGTVRSIATSTIKAMISSFGSNPKEILAGIGPSIGPDHYEVGVDVVSQVHNAFGGDSSDLIREEGEQFYFDLWAANRLQLEREGVRMIESSGICTACHTGEWFSHRAEHGVTGRFGAVIAL